MIRRTLVSLAILLTARTAFCETLTFQQVLSRAEQAYGVPSSASESADLLDAAARKRGGTAVRVETSAISANGLDAVERNVFRYDALTALLAVDYPLFDGGMRDTQAREARVDAQLFRQQLRRSSDALYREVVVAVARLAAAQERARTIKPAVDRALALRERAQQMLGQQQITAMTAAHWQDVALAAESLAAETELQRLDAETRVRQLTASSGAEPIEIVLHNDTRATAVAGEPPVTRESLVVDRRRVELEEAEAARKLQLTLSAFGGVTALSNIAGNDSGSYGLFGVRFTVALPMFDAATARRAAQARMQLEQANLDQKASADQLRTQDASLRIEVTAQEKRIAILERLAGVARSREESIASMLAAGQAQEGDVAEAALDRARREADLAAARAELWKANQLLRQAAETR